MKLFSIFSFIYLTFFLTEALSQPVATASCTGSTVSLTGGIPAFGVNLYNTGFQSQSTCGATVLNPALTMVHRTSLQKLNSSTGNFATVSGPQSGNTFSGVAHGIYRLMVEIPLQISNPSCPGGSIKVFNTGGQHVGFRGRFGSEAEGGVFFSNQVAIGTTVQNDLTYSFVDGGGGDNLPNGFDYTETATINTTGSENYDSWWLAITELGGYHRYKTNGWTSGILPATIDLSIFWAAGTGWGFQSLNSYRVQLAISGPCNSQWTVLEKDFFVCPSGSGCRVAEMEVPINISPNPTYNSFRLTNFDFDAYPQGNLQLVLTDMSGRKVKSFSSVLSEVYDISDLAAGLYIVNLWNGAQRLHTAKLSVLR